MKDESSVVVMCCIRRRIRREVVMKVVFGDAGLAKNGDGRLSSQIKNERLSQSRM